MEERRKHSRVGIPQILLCVPSSRKFRREYLDDLSEGGLFIQTKRKLSEGQEVQIELVPPGWEKPIGLSGRVVRVETVTDDSDTTARQGAAVEFDHLDSEATKSLASLLAEYSRVQDEESSEEMQELQGRVESLTGELSEARKAAKELERTLEKQDRELESLRPRAESLAEERDELLARNKAFEAELEKRSSVAPAPTSDQKELEKVKKELGNLREELKEARDRVSFLEGELSEYEKNEEASRKLVERLAVEKNRLEQSSLESSERSAAEIERLRSESEGTIERLGTEVNDMRQRLEELEHDLKEEQSLRQQAEEGFAKERTTRTDAEAQVAVLQRNIDDITTALKEAESQLDQVSSLRIEVEESRARAERLERQLGDALTQLDKSRARERDLRRLAALVSAEGKEEVVMVEDSEAEAEAVEVIEAMEEDPLSPEASDAAPSDLDEDTAKIDIDPELLEQKGTPEPIEEPVPEPVGESAPADEEEPILVSEEVEEIPPIPRVETLEDFGQQLGAGARLRKTSSFGRHEVINRPDVLLSSWLDEAETLVDVLNLSRGELSEEQIVEVAYHFYQRSMVELYD